MFAMIDLRDIQGFDRQLGYHANFRNFSTAFLTMFRAATGEAWNSMMFETMWQPSILHQCDPNESYESIVKDGRDPDHWLGPRGCGNHDFTLAFFLLFDLIFAQIYLNVMIAIIVDVFSGISTANGLPIDD